MSRRNEQLLFRYSSALERGDFDTVAEVLHDAEHDPALEQMILDVNAAYTAEPSLNHKNPKEVPMIAALYQKHPPVHVRWQSLPLVAALAVIGLLVAMLAVQTRGANFSNGGQGSTPLAVAQNNSLCQAIPLVTVNVLSLPSTSNGVVVGTIPSGFTVSVLDQAYFTNPQGDIQELWYFIVGSGVQGWTSPTVLNTSNCPANQVVQPASPSYQQVQTATSQAALLATATQMIIEATSSAEYPTFTPTPAPFLETTVMPPTVVPPVNDTAGTAQHPFLIAPTFDPLVMTAIVATLNATYQPMPTMIPAYNSGQSATACNTPSTGDPHDMSLYAEPTSDAAIVGVLYTVDATQSNISVLQATYVAGQTWYYIEIGTYPNQPRGFVSKDQFDAVMGSCNITYVQPLELATPTLIPAANADQASNLPTVKCPTPTYRVIMYARPSLEAYKFSQDYDTAHYQFTLLDSTDADNQTWYYVEIDTFVSQKQGWITGDDYNVVKDCAPFNTTAQANAVPSDGTIPLVPTVVPPAASGLAIPTLVPPMASGLAIPTLVVADVPPVLFGTGVLLDTCHFDLSNTVTLYAEPSNDAKVTEILHIGTSLEVTAPTADWYWVTVRYPDGVGSMGFVRADALTLPDDCHLTPGTTAALVPTLVPAGQPAPLVPTLVPSGDPETIPSVSIAEPFLPIYTHYVVQPDDTLLSILGRFNLDASVLPKFAFINNLSENALLDVGTALLIPTPTNAQPLTCVVSSQQTVELRAHPFTDAPVLLTLPAGTVFQISDRNQLDDQTWYAVTAQINQTTIGNVWVQMDTPPDCQRFAPDSPASAFPIDPAIGDVLQPTPTLVR